MEELYVYAIVDDFGAILGLYKTKKGAKDAIKTDEDYKERKKYLRVEPTIVH